MRFPDECPAFEYRGQVYEGRPTCWTTSDGEVVVVNQISLVNSHGEYFELFSRLTLYSIKPLTPAAVDLIQWVLQ